MGNGNATSVAIRGSYGPRPPPGAPFGEYHPTSPGEYVQRTEEHDERVIPSTPSSERRSPPLPVPGRASMFIQPSHTGLSVGSTPTQESYHPPYSPGALPIPVGDVPNVIPVDPSFGGPRPGYTPPPQQITFPPPGHIIDPGIPVQPSITIQQPGMPIHLGGVAIHPSLQGVQPGPIVIHPPMPGQPVPVSESVYVPSRATSRTSTRAPVVIVQSSQDGSPLHIPPSAVGVPPSVHVHHHHDHVHRSPTIQAFPGVPVSWSANYHGTVRRITSWSAFS